MRDLTASYLRGVGTGQARRFRPLSVLSMHTGTVTLSCNNNRHRETEKCQVYSVLSYGMQMIVVGYLMYVSTTAAATVATVAALLLNVVCAPPQQIFVLEI